MMRSLFVRSDYVLEHLASECFVVSVFHCCGTDYLRGGIAEECET